MPCHRPSQQVAVVSPTGTHPKMAILGDLQHHFIVTPNVDDVSERVSVYFFQLNFSKEKSYFFAHSSANMFTNVVYLISILSF